MNMGVCLIYCNGVSVSTKESTRIRDERFESVRDQCETLKL